MHKKQKQIFLFSSVNKRNESEMSKLREQKSQKMDKTKAAVSVSQTL